VDGINFDKDFDRNYKSKKLCFNHHETSSAAVRDEVAGESMLKEMRVCLSLSDPRTWCRGGKRASTIKASGQ
jgi:hypothetical protein